MFTVFFIICFLSACIDTGSCWDNEDLELFDLVEEVNQNFYDVLGVEQSASTSEIRKTYRKLSLQLHPDKNKEEDAEIKFRQLVAIYEILKDPERRQKYDLVLVEGLPDWRQPVYYYRRVRKMGLVELAILLFFIFTIGHFIVIWTVYLERRFVAEEVFHDRKKKRSKKNKKSKQLVEDDDDDILQEELESIPRPKLVDILPCKFVSTLIWLVVSVPGWVSEYRAMQAARREDERLRAEQQRLEEEEMKEALERAKRPKPRKRVDLPPEKTADDVGGVPVVYQKIGGFDGDGNDLEAEKQQKKGVWSDAELALLAKAFAKFPGGSHNRWEKMAAFVQRPTADVIAKCKEMKGGVNRHVDAAAQGITGKLADPAMLATKVAPKDNVISERDPLTENTTANHSKPHPGKTKQSATTNNSKQMSSKEKEKQTTTNQKVAVEETVAGDAAVAGVWTQDQQKIFEWGLSTYPKGTGERWEKIASHIPDKTKEDCISRFKYLADMVKKRRAEAASS